MTGRLNPASIEHVLRSNVIGRLGCHAKKTTYVIPITYVYDGHYIYGHTNEGLKTELLDINPNVCFQVDEIANMANWQSVICWGVFQRLEGKEAMNALNIITNRLEPYLTSITSHPDQGRSPRNELTQNSGLKFIVYRIKLENKTGRFEKQI